MQIATDRFGLLKVDEDRILKIKGGLLGFSHLERYIIIDLPENPFFHWLQALDDPGVAFLLVDPFVFVRDYQVELKAEWEKEIMLDTAADAVVYTIVAIPPEGIAAAVTNLLGPLVFNVQKGLGMQVVLENVSYSLRHPLFARGREEKGEAG